MTDKKKAAHHGSPDHSSTHDTSISSQQRRLLRRLQDGPIDTITARRELNIMMPASRVKELREMGYPILTQRITGRDENGRKHPRIALYFLGHSIVPDLKEAA